MTPWPQSLRRASLSRRLLVNRECKLWSSRLRNLKPKWEISKESGERTKNSNSLEKSSKLKSNSSLKRNKSCMKTLWAWKSKFLRPRARLKRNWWVFSTLKLINSVFRLSSMKQSLSWTKLRAIRKASKRRSGSWSPKSCFLSSKFKIWRTSC